MGLWKLSLKKCLLAKNKTPETIKAHIIGAQKAIQHLTNAVKALERIPAHDWNGETPYYIRQIEELISSVEFENLSSREGYSFPLRGKVYEGVFSKVPK